MPPQRNIEELINWVAEGTDPNQVLNGALSSVDEDNRNRIAENIIAARQLLQEANKRFHNAIKGVAMMEGIEDLIWRINDIGDKISTCDIEAKKVLSRMR